MELIAHFINNYSDNFIVALALWPLASGVMSVPLIALLYHRDGRMHLNTVIGAYLSVLYALSLVCFTLYPLPSGESGLGITSVSYTHLPPPTAKRKSALKDRAISIPSRT